MGLVRGNIFFDRSALDFPTVYRRRETFQMFDQNFPIIPTRKQRHFSVTTQQTPVLQNRTIMLMMTLLTFLILSWTALTNLLIEFQVRSVTFNNKIISMKTKDIESSSLHIIVKSNCFHSPSQPSSLCLLPSPGATSCTCLLAPQSS